MPFSSIDEKARTTSSDSNSATKAVKNSVTAANWNGTDDLIDLFTGMAMVPV